jgi:hypothetical protein
MLEEVYVVPGFGVSPVDAPELWAGVYDLRNESIPDLLLDQKDGLLLEDAIVQHLGSLHGCPPLVAPFKKREHIYIGLTQRCHALYVGVVAVPFVGDICDDDGLDKADGS